MARETAARTDKEQTGKKEMMNDGRKDIMKNTEFKKKAYSGIAGIILVAAFTMTLFVLDTTKEEDPYADSDLEGLGIEARFSVLSEQRTNSCGGGKDYVGQLSADGTRIQGSCCSAMSEHSYKEQIEGLKEYSGYTIIPSDPYDVSSQWAEDMIAYNDETALTQEQQAVYDEAMEVSHEGPCCCMCWHWYAYSGLAKYLIINEDFSAQQVADVWNLSDACGGEHNHREEGGGF